MCRCSSEVRPQLDAVLATALKYLRYDPNYADDEDEDEDMEAEEEDDDFG